MVLTFRLRCGKTSTNAFKMQGNTNNSSREGVRTLTKEDRMEEAVHILGGTSPRVDDFTYHSLLQGCLDNKTLGEAKLIHGHMIQTQFKFQDISLGNKLVTLYAKYGNLLDARRVFDHMPERDVISWTVIIAAYPKLGYSEESLALFHQMQRTGIQPNRFTFASVLPSCANLEALERGMEIHNHIVRSGFQCDLSVGNALVDMYAKCRSIETARIVFDKMPQRDVVSWNTLLAGYLHNRQVHEGLKLFVKMPERNVVSWNVMIAGYAQNGHPYEAMKLFEKMTEWNVISWNSMIAGYAQNGYVDEALKLFQKMPERNVVSWNALIAGYAQNGYYEEALELFKRMQLVNMKPNSKTFVSVLPACAGLTDLEQGNAIHEEVIRIGCQSDVSVGNALVDMYAKCGVTKNARHVFDEMTRRDTVSWNAMIAGYAQNGNIDEALRLFQKMPSPNVVSWTAMIAGCAQNGFSKEALRVFRQMQLVGVKPNAKTFASVLPACSNLATLDQGKEIHEEIIINEIQSDVFVGSALVDMYAKCERIESARYLFDKMSERNVVSWNAMIAGYAQSGQGEEALKLFRQMHLAGVKTNSKTYTSVLSACASLTALEQGKEIHGEIIRSGIQSELFAGSALVDMYAKCGSIENARYVFDKLHRRDLVSWNAMIAGYAMHGCGKEALNIFEQMQHYATDPDHVTLVGVLSACCHAGLVDEGRQYFDCMDQYYHITPAMEHYGCIVDLLGRAGHLDEAQDFINKMPIKPDATTWGCLLGACKIHKNLELGERVAEYLFELDPKNAASYVLLSSIYAEAGRWDDIENVRKMMRDSQVKKKPGCSWIEINKQVHVFLAGDS
eukprot:Gb_25869 [translate_table: standard]